MRSVLLFLSLISLCPLAAAEVKVTDPESARKAVRDARPGDVVILASGEWRDIDLRLDGEGTADQPVTIRAEEPGKTIITGASRVRLGGSHLVISGLFFKNLSGADADWLEFRIDSKRRANFCRVTDCAFLELPDFIAKETENRWIGLYGEGNQLDRCSIEGKKNKGATVVVWLGESDPGRHRIQANYFGERPRLGKNGGETIRVGDSKTMKLRPECLVEGNYFYRCDGETECISNKSGGNVYRGNWFVETQGTLTLRHGNDCLVEGNIFLGKKRKQTGGIRVIGSGHRVIGNHLVGLEGDGFRSALCFVNGIPDSPDNGYHQVVGAEVRDNVVVDCGESLLIGYNDVEEATLPPQDLIFEGNLILAREGSPAVRVDRPAIGTAWKSNRIEGAIIGNSTACEARRPLYRNSRNSPNTAPVGRVKSSSGGVGGLSGFSRFGRPVDGVRPQGLKPSLQRCVTRKRISNVGQTFLSAIPISPHRALEISAIFRYISSHDTPGKSHRTRNRSHPTGPRILEPLHPQRESAHHFRPRQ